MSPDCTAGGSVQQGDTKRRPGKGQAGSAAPEEESSMKDETALISVARVGEVQSDLNPQDPLQKVVRFSPDLSLLLTGGTDGHVRVWEVNRPVVLLTRFHVQTLSESLQYFMFSFRYCQLEILCLWLFLKATASPALLH